MNPQYIPALSVLLAIALILVGVAVYTAKQHKLGTRLLALLEPTPKKEDEITPSTVPNPKDEE